jgi:hypothetical protein
MRPDVSSASESLQAFNFPGSPPRGCAVLEQHYKGKPRLGDVKEMFVQMRPMSQ